jgi:ectoine hydroxylase-related dioxygenase (phytanoyl-CoA dioxygenase family)
MTVTDTHAEYYRRDGAVLIEGAFTSWVAPLASAIDEVLAKARDPSFSSGGAATHQNALRIEEEFGGGVMALNMVPFAPTFSEWQWRSPAAEIVARVMGSRYARYWVDATFLKEKPSESESTPWHNDVCTWPFWGEKMAILWIALTEVDMDNAPLRTVLGSHRGHSRYDSPFFPAHLERPAVYRPWQELLDRATAPDAPIKAWTMTAGDCLVVHPATIHSSLPRRAAAGRRLAFSTRWLGDDVAWKPDILTERLTATLTDNPKMKRGGPPPDDIFPIVWNSAA